MSKIKNFMMDVQETVWDFFDEDGKIAKSGKLFVEYYHTNKIRIGEIIDIINR